MEEKVSDNFTKMMDTQNEIINKTLIPQGPSADQQMGMALMTEMMKDPSSKKSMMKIFEASMRDGQGEV